MSINNNNNKNDEKSTSIIHQPNLDNEKRITNKNQDKQPNNNNNNNNSDTEYISLNHHHNNHDNVPNVKSLTVGELYNKDHFDLATMDTDDIFILLQTTPEGLTEQEAKARIEKFGYNRLEHKEINPLLQFLGFMWNPLSWVMEAAAFVAIVVSNGEGRSPDWPDFIGIVLLLLANATIGFWEEHKAGNAVKALMESLAPECKVKRDSQWQTMEAAELVPGDIINIKLGDVIPADGRLIEAHGDVSIDQAALTGESLPAHKEPGDEIFSGSTVKQGEAEAIVIGTGLNTFFGRAAKLVGDTNDDIGHLQQILSKIGNFCLISIGTFLLVELLVMYAAFHFHYRRGIDNILVLLIGGIPIAMPTVLSVTLAIGAQQLADHKAIVTRISAIEEMAAVTILCSDKTGTLTMNKLIVDHTSIKTYSEFNQDQVLRIASYASRMENQDAIDFCIINSLSSPELARRDITELKFKPFNPVIKRTEITYKDHQDGKIKQATKGMSHFILDLCTRDKNDDLIKQLNDDVNDFANRGLRSLAVAINEFPPGSEPIMNNTSNSSNNSNSSNSSSNRNDSNNNNSNNNSTEGEHGLGFKLIGLLPIYDPPRNDTKETIHRAIALGVQVKMITGDQLAIAKETGRRLGMGDNMFLSKTLKEGPPAGSGYSTIDDLILSADGFAGVYPEHKYEIVDRIQKLGHMVAMTGDGVNDAPALSKANVGVAVADSSDAARAASDIVLTEPGLSVIIEALLHSRQIFQRMRNYSIYTCSITIRVVVGFAIMVFAFQFDFPPFMVLILAVLNDGTIMTISKDRVKPSPYPDQWNLFEIFTSAIVYGLYLATSTLSFFAVAFYSTFFQTRFGAVSTFQTSNDFILHSIIYLQVSTISQALIFVTRSQGFFFMERPGLLLICAFLFAQLLATIISVYANWEFARIKGCGWAWAGIVWVWNIIWFLPLDMIKFCLQFFFNKQRQRRALVDESDAAATTTTTTDGRRSSIGSGISDSITTSSSGRYYSSYTRSFHLFDQPHHRRRFLFGNNHGSKNNRNMSIHPKELRRLSHIQARDVSNILSGENSSRP